MLIGIEADHANKLERTGVEEYCWQIIQALKKIIPSSEKVILYSRSPLQGELASLPLNWESKVLPWRLKKLWSQIRLSFELGRRPPDVFFAPGQLIPFGAPQNTIVMAHDSAFLAYPEAYNFWGRQYLKWMNARIMKKAKTIVTSTEFNKKEMLKYYLVEENKIIVIPLAYDEARFSPFVPLSPYRGEIERGVSSMVVERDPTLDPSPKRGGKPRAAEETDVLNKYFLNSPFIIFVGRLEKKKNVARIISSFARLKHEYGKAEKIKNLKLVLVGKPGVGWSEIREAIARCFYKEDIRILGWTEGEDLPCLLRAAEAFVFPSLYEGFGLPLLEAMACGCPVVASVGSALPEVGAEAAVYVNPDREEEIVSALAEILQNEEKQVKMRQAGLVRVKDFSWESTAGKLNEEMKKPLCSKN